LRELAQATKAHPSVVATLPTRNSPASKGCLPGEDRDDLNEVGSAGTAVSREGETRVAWNPIVAAPRSTCAMSPVCGPRRKTFEFRTGRHGAADFYKWLRSDGVT